MTSVHQQVIHVILSVCYNHWLLRFFTGIWFSVKFRHHLCVLSFLSEWLQLLTVSHKNGLVKTTFPKQMYCKINSYLNKNQPFKESSSIVTVGLLWRDLGVFIRGFWHLPSLAALNPEGETLCALRCEGNQETRRWTCSLCLSQLVWSVLSSQKFLMMEYTGHTQVCFLWSKPICDK